MTVLLLSSLLLLTSACGPKPTPSTQLTGALSELSGTVNGKQAEEADFHPVAAGEVLQIKGQVQTGGDGRVRIDLSSGTIIRVAPSSLFTLESNEPAEGGLATKLKLELGRIFIILSGGSLDVETPSGVASVLGSYLMVEIDPLTQNIVVTCLEGDCSAGGFNFTDGQKVTLFFYDPATSQYRPPLLEDMNDEDFQKWLDANPEARHILDLFLAAHPTATSTLTPVPPTATPVPQSNVIVPENTCFNLLAPPDGAALTSGLVTFSWEPQVEAVEYRLVFTSPGGVQNSLKSSANSLTNYIDILPTGGTYSWDVTAYNANGELICTASAFSFTKPVSPTLVPIKPTREKPEPLVCTTDDAQWVDASLPCYCDPYQSADNPPYCYGGGY
jgi:hypothetical protein